MKEINGKPTATADELASLLNVTVQAFRNFVSRNRADLIANCGILELTHEQKLLLNVRNRYVFTFEGAMEFLERSHHRNHEKVKRICDLFEVDPLDYYTDFEPIKEFTFAERLKRFLDGITHVEQQVTILNYRIDMYLPEYKLAIEFDEYAHKYREGYDVHRQTEIEKALGCQFLRIKEGELIEDAFNKIIKFLLRAA